MRLASLARLAGVVTRGYTEGMVTNVRNAKAKLSELLERAARGEEIVITSGGRPKARLVSMDGVPRPYRVHWKLLGGGARRGRRAETLVREDRDSRD